MREIISRGEIRHFPFISLNDYIEEVNCNMLNHLPALAIDDPLKSVTLNYVCIGFLDRMDIFAEQFRARTGLSVKAHHLNKSTHSENLDPAVARRWTERNSAEVQVYSVIRDFVLGTEAATPIRRNA